MAFPILSIPDQTTRERYMRAHLAATSRAETAACWRCTLRYGCQQPVPSHGPITTMDAKLALISPFPSPTDEQTGEAFSSVRERDLLREMIPKYVGVDLGQCVMIHALACRPATIPAPDHYFACSSHLQAQLTASGAKVVALFGRDTLPAFSPVLPFQPWEEVRGKGWHDSATDRTFFVLDHPLDVARNRNLLGNFVENLRTLGRLVYYRFARTAADLFRSGDKAWPRLIDETLHGLNPVHSDWQRMLFTLRVIGESGATAEEAAQILAEQPELFETEEDRLESAIGGLL